MSKAKETKKVIKTADNKGRSCWYVVFGENYVARITGDKLAVGGIRVDIVSSTVCCHYELINYLSAKLKEFKKEVIDKK